MKKNILIVIGIIITLAVMIAYIFSFKTSPGNKQMSDKSLLVTAGGLGYDYGSEVVVDKNGSMYVLGSFQGSTRFGNIQKKSLSFSDIFLIKYSNQGDIEWFQTIGAPDNQLLTCTNLALDDSSNVYIAGEGGKNAVFADSVRLKTDELSIHGFIAKYNTKGKILWAEAIPIKGGGTVSINDLAVDKHGNSYLTGSFRDTINYTNASIASFGDADIFLGKFNSHGKTEWIKSAGGTGFDSAKSLALDNNDGVYISGFFSSDARFGHINKPSSGQRDMFLAKYTTKGQLQWAESAEGLNDEDGEKIVTDTANNIYVIGHISGRTKFGDKSTQMVNSYSMFIAKYAPDGKPVWVKSQEDKAVISISTAAIDKNGNLYIGAYFSGTCKFGNIEKTSAGYSDILVGKYDNKGDILSVKTAGGNVNDFGMGIALDDSLRVYVTGLFGAKADFDDITEISSGDSDIFIWRFAQ